MVNASSGKCYITKIWKDLGNMCISGEDGGSEQLKSVLQFHM